MIVVVIGLCLLFILFVNVLGLLKYNVSTFIYKTFIDCAVYFNLFTAYLIFLGVVI